MATISIADNDARVQYTQAVTANTTQLTIDFPFFDSDDINVIVTSAAGVDTTLTRGTGTGTFAVVGTSVDDGFSGGYVTLGDTYSDANTKYTIFRDIDVERTTDFPTSGPFNISSLNTELDKIFAIEQELETKIGRTMKLADSDTAATLSLPNLDTRKGTVLAFNTTTGLPEAGPEIGDVSTIAAITTDIGTLADIEDGTDATDAIQTVAGISSNVTTVAGISSNVSTVAGISANVTTVAGDSSDITALAAKTTEIGRLGTADAVSDLNTLGTADVVSDMNTLATASNVTNMNTLAGISANITTVAGISANVTTVAGDSADIQAVAADAADIGTVASNISDVNTAATNITDIQNASTNAATATTKAAEAATSATNAATSATNASTSATNAATSATAAAASQTAAAASAASAASAFDNFDDTYLGSKTSDPTTDNDGDPLTSGDLYFNSTANEMRVYDGANWIAATSAGNVSLILYEYTATAGQTTFSGSDDNSATLSYTVDNLQVVMNGVVLDPSDFTATNGTSVVLASGAALNDIVNIYAFKSFTTADMVSKTAGGTFSGAVGFSGGITGDVAFDTNTLKVDSSNNRVGIGDTTPDDTLTVYGGTQRLRIGNNDSNHVRIGRNSSTGHFEMMRTATGITDQVFFKAIEGDNGNLILQEGGGNVGIGTSSIASGGANTTNFNVHTPSATSVYFKLSNSSTGNTASDGFDLSQDSSGNAYLVNRENANMTFWTNATERMRIDSSGNMLVAKTALDNNTVGARFNVTGDASFVCDGNRPLVLNRKTSDGDLIIFLQDGSTQGYISTPFDTSLGIFGPGGNGAGFVFQDNYVITPGRNGSRVDDIIDLGNSTFRFNDAFIVNGVTTGSDENEKQQIASLTSAEMTAAKAISKLFKTFKWNDAVAAKGNAARIHTGVMAQQVATALTDAGLNPDDYAFYMSDTWWETSTDVSAVEADEEAGIEARDAYTRIDTYDTADDAPEGATQRTRFGIRYPELLAFIGAATEQRLADIETRLTALEAGQ